MKNFIKAVLLTFLFPTFANAGSELTLILVSLDNATKQVRKDARLRVLGAKTEIIDGKEVHVIKVLTADGRIQHHKIDAETGRMLGKGQ